MNSFEKALENDISPENLKKIQNVKIGIAGAGGLGSNCAFNLVRSGFLNFKILDFDIVEPSNLNRQFYFYDQIGLPKVEALKVNLTRINPNINVEIQNIKIDSENASKIFVDCDVVVEAFDSVEYKILLVERYYSSGKLLVSASGLAGFGNSDAILVKKIRANFYIIGDLQTEVSKEKPPLSPRVNVAAAKQADVILEYILGSQEVKNEKHLRY